MTTPDFQTIMLPLLNLLSDRKEHSLWETVEYIANYFHLSPNDQKTMLHSGQETVIHNRVSWACTYMKKAGLVDSTRRGYFKITERGVDVLSKKPDRIDNKLLDQFPEFREFRKTNRKEKSGQKRLINAPETPSEILENAYQELRDSLADELLQRVKQSPPKFFENLVVELLVKMGYGGSRKDAGEAIGQSGDEGIDGIIRPMFLLQLSKK